MNCDPRYCIKCLSGYGNELIQRCLSSENDYSTLKNELSNHINDLVEKHAPFSSPPVISEKITSYVEEMTGIDDFYEKEKREANQSLKDQIERYKNENGTLSIKKALYLSAIGNMLDCKAPGGLHDINIAHILDGYRPFIDHSDKLEEDILTAGTICIIGDNAGEIVCDLELCTLLKDKKIVYLVRSYPIQNDVTIEDAREIGMDKFRHIHVIETGSRVPGLVINDLSPDLFSVINESDVIIAKGQGNFETLYKSVPFPVYHIFTVKCIPVSRLIGVAPGEGVIYYSQ